MNHMDIAIRAYVCRNKPVVPVTPSEKPKKKYYQKHEEEPWVHPAELKSKHDETQFSPTKVPRSKVNACKDRSRPRKSCRR